MSVLRTLSGHCAKQRPRLAQVTRGPTIPRPSSRLSAFKERKARCRQALGTRTAALRVENFAKSCRRRWQDRGMRHYMKYLTAVLMSFIFLFSSGVTLAARAQAENTTVSAQSSENQGNATGKEIKSPNTTQPDTSNRASLLYILLVAGVMIVVVNLIVSYAKKKMEEEAKVAQEKSGSEPLNPKS